MFAVRKLRTRSSIIARLSQNMIASFGSTAQNFALTWLPVMFFLLMLFVAYLLWRTTKLMPRVKPNEIAPSTSAIAELSRSHIANSASSCFFPARVNE